MYKLPERRGGGGGGRGNSGNAQKKTFFFFMRASLNVDVFILREPVDAYLEMGDKKQRSARWEGEDGQIDRRRSPAQGNAA